jgi:hypothetical protein
VAPPPSLALESPTLPARGPHPALKGEEKLTLRLMDDVVVPRMMAAAAYTGSYPSIDRPQASSRPASFPSAAYSAMQSGKINKILYAPPSVCSPESAFSRLLPAGPSELHRSEVRRDLHSVPLSSRQWEPELRASLWRKRFHRSARSRLAGNLRAELRRWTVP